MGSFIPAVKTAWISLGQYLITAALPAKEKNCSRYQDAQNDDRSQHSDKQFSPWMTLDAREQNCFTTSSCVVVNTPGNKDEWVCELKRSHLFSQISLCSLPLLASSVISNTMSVRVTNEELREVYFMQGRYVPLVPCLSFIWFALCSARIRRQRACYSFLLFYHPWITREVFLALGNLKTNRLQVPECPSQTCVDFNTPECCLGHSGTWSPYVFQLPELKISELQAVLNLPDWKCYDCPSIFCMGAVLSRPSNLGIWERGSSKAACDMMSPCSWSYNAGEVYFLWTPMHAPKCAGLVSENINLHCVRKRWRANLTKDSGY